MLATVLDLATRMVVGWQMAPHMRTSLIVDALGMAIDGGHDEEVCRHDTVEALKLARPGGAIVWDDYTPYWPGVRTVVEEVATRRPLFHFPRLGLVVHLMEL